MMLIDKKTVAIIILTVCFILFGSLYSYFKKQSRTPTEVNVQATTISSDNDTETEGNVVGNMIKIYITGEVNQPGTYDLSENSRVEDAVNAAGGATDAADLTKINLAAHIRDAQHIAVPAKGSDSGEETSDSRLVNINTATAEELVALPQIGPVTAENIIRYREENGHFVKIEDIKNVTRIGEKTFESIRDFITVD